MKKNNGDKKLVYCGIRDCPHHECLRHNINTPFNVLILRENFKPNKEWNCKDIIVDKK